MKIQKYNKKRILKIRYLLPILASICILIFLGVWEINRINGYLKSSGETNMRVIMEQMEQTYEIQNQKAYDSLERIERYLFRNGNRSFQLEDQEDFLIAITDDEDEVVIFLKETGYVLTMNGVGRYIDIPTTTLIKLQQNQRVTQTINFGIDSDKRIYYMSVIPTQPFTINGDEFKAIGLLSEESGFDSLLGIDAYNGEAQLFSIDENGIVVYTNIENEEYIYNYSLMKRMLTNGIIKQEQYDSINAKIKNGISGVELIEIEDELYYFSFLPLESSNNDLICIVPVSVQSSSFIEYQQLARRLVALAIFILSVLGILLTNFIAKNAKAMERVKFEEEKRIIQEETMKALEVEKNRANQANLAKSRFLSNISHDIRTPMNAIIGYTNLAIDYFNDQNKLQDYLEKIKISSDHLLSLINDVLDMSRIESGQMKLKEEPFSLLQIIDELKNIFISTVKEKDLSIKIELIDVVHEYIVCDKMRISQIFINIVSNAIKYTNPKGIITIKVIEEPSSDDTMASFKFSIKDTGIGMTDEFKKIIFEPFAREDRLSLSRIEGTGLGMSITKKIIDLMNGTIKVNSTLGVGSEFIVSLRLKIANDYKTNIENEDNNNLKISGKRILLVDDLAINREIVMTFLEMVGAIVETAENGEIALEMLKISNNNYYDLVLMDVMMPVMDGYQATKEIRKLEDKKISNIPIIAMTANAFEDDRQNAINAGMNDYISKPIKVETLYSVIKKYL